MLVQTKYLLDMLQILIRSISLIHVLEIYPTKAVRINAKLHTAALELAVVHVPFPNLYALYAWAGILLKMVHVLHHSLV